MNSHSHSDRLSNASLVTWKGRYSLVALLGAALGAGLVTILILAATAFLQPMRDSPTVWITLGLLIVLIWTGLVGLGIIRKLNRQYELNDTQLIHRRGILFRRIDRIELIDIDDIAYRQGPLQTIMGVGSIEIQSSDLSHPKLVLTGITGVSDVANMIDAGRRHQRQQHGLHIEQV